MREFLHMGGYAFYVWTAYGLAAAVLVGLLVNSLARHRRLVKRLAERGTR
jgi:heme exporter protein D